MEEIWKDIPDYEGLYQVSNLGRVKSLPKEWITHNGSIHKRNGKVKKIFENNRGYVMIGLWQNSKRKNYFVHQLVAMAFLGHKRCGMKLVIDHINDNKTDNRLENLQIVTTRFNSKKTQGNYSSKYKGVHRHSSDKFWVAAIQINGKTKHIGSFECELKAHQAYQDAINNLHL
jgi:hypothetical protein